ncbi:uncharacterized protein BO87DRAFT_413209 [Aspergillus neoniger CBS 115656]|uniref:Uncharacterized protein n=1 Tax=Aspergillus neoniger (strain CBS 115656) TaxID=1448310 RepID=A0A318YSW4_ASPNB|nr:hypothetical protein BO87DRAFT_413209 [Aspergillus neoniger CBS 115656]PYH37815.1 hypothetical protein BO87DRAFT_413209 [Aspergillus neoniger CBS 115656]
MLRIFNFRLRKTASREQEDTAPATPTTPSRFLSHLSKHPDKPTRQLLQPYLEYETWLRRQFTTPKPTIGGSGDLVSVYAWRQSSLRIRTTDRNETPAAQYIMPLENEQRLPEGAPAIAASFAEFQYQFEAFTHGVLQGIDWSNIVVAGSAALIPLLPIREDVSLTATAAVERREEHYYQTIADASDIDIFIYGINSEEAAIKRIQKLEAVIRKNQRLIPGEGLCLRTKNTVTFISPKWPFRHIQVVLRLYRSVTEILTGFDVDCACVAFDGRHVYTTPRGATAIATRTNTINLTRRSPSYEMRLFKYRKQNFEVFWESLDRSRVDMDLFEKLFSDRSIHPKNVKGLARLILGEIAVSGRYAYSDYLTTRALKKLDDARDPELIGPTVYTSIEVPYTKRLTADDVRSFVASHSSIPFLFGTLDQIIKGSGSRRPQDKDLAGRLSFMKDNPGRQMIGSFYPLDERGWAEAAYEIMEYLSDSEEYPSESDESEDQESDEQSSDQQSSDQQSSDQQSSDQQSSDQQSSDQQSSNAQNNGEHDQEEWNNEEDSSQGNGSGEQEFGEQDSEQQDSTEQNISGEHSVLQDNHGQDKKVEESKEPGNRETGETRVLENGDNTGIPSREQ